MSPKVELLRWSLQPSEALSNIALLEWLRVRGDVDTRVAKVGTSAAWLRNVEVLEWLFAHYPDAMHDAVDMLREEAHNLDRWYVYEWLGLV